MDEHVSDRISRRTILKRIGAGAAVAWSAPILTSIATPAFAQASGGACAGGTCPPCQFGSPCLSVCACVGIPDTCFCSDLGECNDVGICQNDQDCIPFTGPGSKCAPCNFSPDTCKGGSCWAPCPGNRVPRVRKGVTVIRFK